MAIVYRPGWNRELRNYARRFGEYQAFLNSFDQNSINKGLFDAKNKFRDRWVREFIAIAMDPFSRETVTIEQGTHQAESMGRGGFCLHFTGRDWGGFAFHFYVKQNQTGLPVIFEITYMDRGRPKSCYRRG